MRLINGRMLLLAFIFSFIGIFICYNYSQSEIPDKKRTEELVNYADGIAYLRVGTNVTSITDKVQGISVKTQLDERNKKPSEVDFIVELQDPDYKGKIKVIYPVNRTDDGKLIIGVNYRKVESYYFTKTIYAIIFVLSLFVFYFILINIQKLRVKKTI